MGRVGRIEKMVGMGKVRGQKSEVRSQKSEGKGADQLGGGAEVGFEI